jgi:hypothetical protein
MRRAEDTPNGMDRMNFLAKYYYIISSLQLVYAPSSKKICNKITTNTYASLIMFLGCANHIGCTCISQWFLNLQPVKHCTTIYMHTKLFMMVLWAMEEYPGISVLYLSSTWTITFNCLYIFCISSTTWLNWSIGFLMSTAFIKHLKGTALATTTHRKQTLHWKTK